MKWRAMLLVFGVLLALGWAVAGCDESADSQSHEQAVRSVNEAGRLVRASRERIVMTPDEIEQAGQLEQRGEVQYERLAGKVVDRLNAGVDMSAFDDAMARIEQLDANDATQLAQISDLLMSASGSLLSEREGFERPGVEANSKRLALAKKRLQSAGSAERSGGGGLEQAGLALAAGTLQLVMGRRAVEELEELELAIQASQIAINRVAAEVVLEQSFEQTAGSGLPDESISTLEGYLETTAPQGGAVGGLRAELAKVDEQIVRLTAGKRQVDGRIETNRQMAAQMHRSHLELLDQAKKTRGDARYDLERQAYELRGGRGDGNGEGAGIIHYEAQAAAARGEQMIIESKLAYLRLRGEQLRETIGRLSETVEQLRGSGAYAAAQGSREQSREYRAALTTDLQNRLDELKKSQGEYVQLRLDAVTSLQEAMKSYRAAASAARGDRKMRSYAEGLAQRATRELAELWLSDADHYDRAAVLLGLSEDVEATRDLVGQMRSDFGNQADQARSSAAELMDQLPEEVEETEADAEDGHQSNSSRASRSLSFCSSRSSICSSSSSMRSS